MSVISPNINENSRHKFTRRSTLKLINGRMKKNNGTYDHFLYYKWRIFDNITNSKRSHNGENCGVHSPPDWASHSSSFLLSSIILPMGFNFVVWSDVVKDLFTWKTTKWEGGEREGREEEEGVWKGGGDDARQEKDGVRWRRVQKNGCYLRLVMKENGKSSTYTFHSDLKRNSTN